jgi:hypothetical protein
MIWRKIKTHLFIISRKNECNASSDSSWGLTSILRVGYAKDQRQMDLARTASLVFGKVGKERRNKNGIHFSGE